MRGFATGITMFAGLWLSCGPLPAHASPILDLAFGVDPSASSLGSPAGVPLNGSLNGVFQKFDRTLTFSGGNDIGLASGFVANAAIPETRVFTAPATSVDVSGSLTATLPGVLKLDVTAGTVRNGDNAGAVTWASQGLGTVSGSVDVVTSVLGITNTSTVLFSAIAAPASSFASVASAGSIGLTDSPAGAKLTLPFALPVTVSNVELQGSGVLGDFFGPVLNFITEFATNQLNALSTLPGTVVATSATHLPALPLDVTYVVDPVRSFLSGGRLGSSFAGTVGAKLLDGELKFSGESAFGFTRQLGAIDNFAVGNLGGLEYDVDLSALSLGLGFGLASGYASNGSSPADLGWALNSGSFTMTGRASLQLGLIGIVDAPFSVTSNLGLVMQLVDRGSKVELVQDIGVETLTIPLAFDGVDASVIDTRIEIEGGLFGALAGVFANQLVPFVEGILLNEIETADYSGTLIATRGIPDPGGSGGIGGPGNPVPAPSTLSLFAVALLAWTLSRHPSYRVRRGRSRASSRPGHCAGGFCSPSGAAGAGSAAPGAPPGGS